MSKRIGIVCYLPPLDMVIPMGVTAKGLTDSTVMLFQHSGDVAALEVDNAASLYNASKKDGACLSCSARHPRGSTLRSHLLAVDP